MKLDRDYWGAMAYVAIILTIMFSVVTMLVSCTGSSLDPRETVEERARRHYEWCQAYCQATDSILTEIRVQGSLQPTCVCLVPEPARDEASCDLEWD